MEDREFDVGGGRVQGFAYNDGQTIHLAIQPGVSEAAKLSRLMEAQSYEDRGVRWSKRFLTWPCCFEEIDEMSVKAQQRRVERDHPDWVREVKEKWIHYRDFTNTVFYSELEPETVKAIVELLWERGEIPPDGEVD